jgi:hypothetical protein
VAFWWECPKLCITGNRLQNRHRSDWRGYNYRIEEIATTAKEFVFWDVGDIDFARPIPAVYPIPHSIDVDTQIPVQYNAAVV